MSSKTIRGKFGIIIFLITVMIFINGVLSYKGYIYVKSVNKTAFPAYKLSDQMTISLISVCRYMSDISSTRALDGRDDGLRIAEDNAKQFKKAADQLKVLKPDKSEEIDDILKAFDDYYTLGVKMANIYIKDGTKSGNKFMPQFDEAYEKILELTNKFAKEQDAEIENSLDESKAQNKISLYIIILSGAILVVFILILFEQAIKALNELLGYTGSMTKRNLIKKSKISDGRDEINKVSILITKLDEDINKAVDRLEETSRINIESQRRSKICAKTTGNIESNMSSIFELNKKNVEKIGDSGLCFSVVSEEIRKLAEASSVSAELITNVVKEIENEIQQVTLYLSNGNKHVQVGVVEGSEASSSFNGIEVNASDILRYVEEVSDFSKDINSVSNKISKYTKDILLIIENSSAFAEEAMVPSEENRSNIYKMSDCINELAKLTEELSGLVRTFKI